MMRSRIDCVNHSTTSCDEPLACDPARNCSSVMRLMLFRRFAPVTDDYRGGKFFVKQGRRYFATPLLVVLLVVETTDVIFAVDSIPAILAITLDPFIVYTSNVFAILGLRALYFAVAGVMKLFHHLRYGLSAILVISAPFQTAERFCLESPLSSHCEAV